MTMTFEVFYEERQTSYVAGSKSTGSLSADRTPVEVSEPQQSFRSCLGAKRAKVRVST